MTTSTKVLVKEKVSVDLALRESAREFFDIVETIATEEVIVDFKGVVSISRSFAHEYLMRKKNSKKKIREMNVPVNVKKMFAVVEEPRVKQPIFNLKTIKSVTL